MTIIVQIMYMNLWYTQRRLALRTYSLLIRMIFKTQNLFSYKHPPDLERHGGF